MKVGPFEQEAPARAAERPAREHESPPPMRAAPPEHRDQDTPAEEPIDEPGYGHGV